MLGVGSAGVYVQAATSLLLVVVGLLALYTTSANRHNVSFSLLLVLWGGFLLAGNLATLAFAAGDVGQAQELLMLHVVLQGTAYLPLVVFALSYPPSRSVSLDNWPTLAALAAPAVGLLAMVAWDPALLHEGFVGEGLTAGSQWGVGKAGALVAFRFAIYLALVRFTLSYVRTGNRLERRQTLYVLLALMLFVGYESVEDSMIFLADGAPLADPITATFVATALAGIGVLAWSVHRIWPAFADNPIWHRQWTIGAVASATGLGLFAGASSILGSLATLPAAGFWRLGALALIVHGVARFDPTGSGRALARGATWVGGLAVVVGGLLSVEMLFESMLGSRLQAFVALQGLVLGGGLFVAAQRPGLWDRLVQRLGPGSRASRRARRRLDAYEAALLSEEEESTLETLRSTLSISRTEHDILADLAEAGEDEASDALPEIAAGDQLQDRYRIEEPIGFGARATVYRAQDTTLARPVAVKVLDRQAAVDPASLRRFVHEARIAVRVKHPHLVHARDLGLEKRTPYLVLELMEGGSLDDKIPDEGLDTARVARLAEGILAGLSHLHEQGLLHGDLKPSNVLLTRGGDAKLGDLALARAWDPEATQVVQGGLGPGQGTPAYMSPEELMGQPRSPRSDVYAVGAILAEALTGGHYLGPVHTNPDRLQRAVLRGLGPRSEDLGELGPVCRKALARDPSKRFASASKMRQAILDAVAARSFETVDSAMGPESMGSKPEERSSAR